MDGARIFGVILLIIGFILFIGNVTGLWPTVSFAGGITMLVGMGILRLASDE